MKRILAIAVCAVAPVVLANCGSSTRQPAYAPPTKTHGPGSIVFVAGGPSTGLGVDNTDLLAASPTGGIRDLTSSPAGETDAAWSADGSRVVFVRQSATGHANGGVALKAGVYVWSPGHGVPRRIASCSDVCSQSDFSWSPDSRQIAFVVDNVWSSDNALDVMNADGSGMHTVCGHDRCGYGLAGPMWSPDGRKLVFSNEGALDTQRFGGSPPSPIWVANADGSGLERLTQPNCASGNTNPQGCAFDTSPAWSRNGRLIAFSSNRVGPGRPRPFGPTGGRRFLPPIITTSIEVMHADGSRPHTIYRCASEVCSETVPLAWSPDGKSVAVGPITAVNSSIRIATLTGETTTLSTCSGSHCVHADELAWSPHGEQLALLAEGGVWTIDRDGAGLHRVGDGTCCLAWVGNVSPNGARPVPKPSAGGHVHLSGTIVYDLPFHSFGLLSLTTAGTHELGVAARAPKEPAWSPDGRKIAFAAPTRTDYRWHIQVADRNGKNVRDLARAADQPAWSPDGQFIAFNQTAGDGSKHFIGVVSATGGDVRRVTSAGREPSWSPRGNELVFATRVPTGQALFIVRLDGRGVRRLTNLPGTQGGPAWSPDGKEIAFTWWTRAGTGLYLIRPDGTHLRRVTTAAVPLGSPTWSPDSRYLIVMADHYGRAKTTPVTVIDVKTGRVSTVATVPGNAADPSWSSR